MGSELDRKDERDFSISVEVGTGAYLPGGKIAVAFKRAWQHRSETYLEDIAEAAEADPDEIIEEVAQGGGFTDVFAAGLQSATSYSDPGFRQTFAQFVALALDDPAKLDVGMYLIEKFGKLRPPHVKVFWTICMIAEKRALGAGTISPSGEFYLHNREAMIDQGVGDSDLLNLHKIHDSVLAALLDDLVSEKILAVNPHGHSLTPLGYLAYNSAPEITESMILPLRDEGTMSD